MSAPHDRWSRPFEVALFLAAELCAVLASPGSRGRWRAMGETAACSIEARRDPTSPGCPGPRSRSASKTDASRSHSGAWTRKVATAALDRALGLR